MNINFPDFAARSLGTIRSGNWLALTQGVHAQLLAYWTVLQVVLIVVAIAILLASSEDLIIDVLYWLGFLVRPFFGQRRPPTKDLVAKPERSIAILIPAWDESAVIAPMLLNSIGQFDYEDYHIFVGVYPNDEATRREVDRIGERNPNVHRVDVSHPGPTTKADCLNHLVRGVLQYERTRGQRFEIFVNHDAEDVVHALELKVMNWFAEDAGMVQLPVLSLNRNPWSLVACHYMDEFAEWHSKDLVVRSAISGMTPSAGVGTALDRKAIDALLADRNGELYNDESLTEDYEVAHDLRRLGFRSRFVRYWADVPTNRKSLFRRSPFRRELVCVREFFPNRVRTSYRQKARWMLGICFYGWRHLGWRGDAINRYFLWRDRKALFTAPVAVIGYLLVVAWLLYTVVVAAVPGLQPLPPLVDKPWVWTIILINLGLMVNRLVHRAIFVGRTHGLRYVPLSPVRAVVSNWVSFLAFCRSLRQLAFSAVTRRAIRWDKTAHIFPASGHGREGNPTIFGTSDEKPAVDDEPTRHAAIVSVDRSPDRFAFSVPVPAPQPVAAEVAYIKPPDISRPTFDPLLVANDVREILPKAVAARFGAFAVERLSATEARIAITEPLARSDRTRLDRALAKAGISRPIYQFAPSNDVAFAVDFAYDRAALQQAFTEMKVLRRLGLIDDDAEAYLWSAIRQQYESLGEVLGRLGAIKKNQLAREIEHCADAGLALGEHLRKIKLISADELKWAVETQRGPPYDVVGLAAQAGFVTLGAADKFTVDASGLLHEKAAPLRA